MAPVISSSSLHSIDYRIEDPQFVNKASILALDKDFSVSTKPYILSNECHREKTREFLAETPALEGAFHIGFSCWGNFDIMAVRGSCGAILADISTLTHEFHEITKAMLLKSDNRFEFLKNILSFLETSPEFLRDDITPESLQKELEREGSWLSHDHSFEKIRALYLEDKILHIRMDIADRGAYDAISDWLRTNKLHCDSFYLSNIPDWFRDNDDAERKMRLLKMAINRVIGRDTYVIHASAYFREGSVMPQRVYRQFPYDPQRAMSQSIE